MEGEGTGEFLFQRGRKWGRWCKPRNDVGNRWYNVGQPSLIVMNNYFHACSLPPDLSYAHLEPQGKTVGTAMLTTYLDEENDSDIWDDTALIKAYDEAVSVMKAKLAEKNGEEPENKSTKKKKQKQKKRKSRSRNLKWSVGDLCRAVYSEDGTVYEAEIISINDATSTCMVRYLGYDNEEEQAFSELLPYKSRMMKTKSTSDIEQSDSGMEWKGQSPAPSRGPSSITTEGKHHHHHHHNRPNGAVEPPPFAFPAMPPPPFPFPGLGPSWFPPGSGTHSGASPSPRIPLVPPPPPPFDESLDGENEALCSMLIAWYMSGYHTGYYQGLQEAHKRGTGIKAEPFVNR